MMDIPERLRTLRVQDIMSGNLVAVHAGQTMNEAAEILLAHEVSGAPVLDAEGRCVGVISTSDFVRLAQCGTSGSPRQVLVQDVTEGPFRLTEVGGDKVENNMSPAVQSISPEALALDAARIMCAQHVHRLPVFDAAGRAVGMVTTLDLVAVLVNLAEEQLTA